MKSMNPHIHSTSTNPSTSSMPHILDTPTQCLSFSSLYNPQPTQPQRLQGESRFDITKQLMNTLQGRIYMATDLVTNKTVIIKEAWRDLVHRNISRTGHKIQEDFLGERQLLDSMSSTKNYPSSLINCIDLWNDSHCYYYAMPLCECELFDFITNHFNYIKNNKITYSQTISIAWIKIIRHIFYQICMGTKWLHNNGYFHGDLSLENVMIYNLSNLNIKIIDFGLCKQWKGNTLFKGKIGKIAYMSPEVYGNKYYSGCKNDIYCLGIMLFMMLIGQAPYKMPDVNCDMAFKWIINGYIKQVLKQWGKLKYINQNVIDLLLNMITFENKRMDINDVVNHAFFNENDNDNGNGNEKYYA